MFHYTQDGSADYQDNMSLSQKTLPGQISVTPMSSKPRLNQRLDEAALLRSSGRFAEAHEMLTSLELEPDVALLGHMTSLGIPRRLH